LKWPSLVAKNRKKLLVYEEKSFVGLTPGWGSSVELISLNHLPGMRPLKDF
jgi:hypothetical protein